MESSFSEVLCFQTYEFTMSSYPGAQFSYSPGTVTRFLYIKALNLVFLFQNCIIESKTKLKLSFLAGDPLPKVTWWKGNTLIDSSDEVVLNHVNLVQSSLSKKRQAEL